MSKFAYAAATAALTLSLLATGAHAQTADAQPDPARLALARQIFEAQGGAKSAQAAMQAVEQAMVSTAQTPEAKEQMTKVMDATFQIFFPKIFDDLAGFYATDFTSDQLKDILAFYKTPTGQAMIAKQPALAAQMGATMAKLMPKLQLKILDQVCSQTACNDQQKQQLSVLKQRVPENERL